jgi:hypothetical protein
MAGPPAKQPLSAFFPVCQKCGKQHPENLQHVEKLTEDQTDNEESAARARYEMQRPKRHQ